MNSEFPGFYKLSIEERRNVLLKRAEISEASQRALQGEDTLTTQKADKMVENVLGMFRLPLGLCTYLKVNDKDYAVPMTIEEPSVVAAASNACKLLRAGGGITASATAPIMIGQIQLSDIPDMDAAIASIEGAKEALLTKARSFCERLVKRGGGPQDIECRQLPPLNENDPLGPMLIVHIMIDVRDAMGANLVNTICEGVAPTLATLSKGRARLRILSNLTDQRLVTVKGRIPFHAFCKGDQPLSFGEETAKGIEEASVFAERDPYRAATHNKGIMNGIDAVLMATGQDYRAVEAGVHAYASRDGRYTALSQWRVKEDGLHGEMTIPLAVGTVGGITRVHPKVRAALKLLDIERAHELAQVAAAVGLAQNVAALRALAMEGIQRGHMRLHARNLAAEVGATDEQIPIVAQRMFEQKTINRDAAASILAQLTQD